MVANWSLADLMVSFPGYAFPFDIGTIGLSIARATATCASGVRPTCATSRTTASTILDSSPMPGPYVNAALSVDLTITPQALATLRTASIAGSPAGTANLALGESTITDPLSVACSAGAGNTLSYALGTLSTTPGVSVAASLQLQVGSSVANPDYPDTDPNPVVYLPPLAYRRSPSRR